MRLCPRFFTAEPQVEEDDEISQHIKDKLGVFAMTLLERYDGLVLTMLGEAQVMFEHYDARFLRIDEGTSQSQQIIITHEMLREAD